MLQENGAETTEERERGKARKKREEGEERRRGEGREGKKRKNKEKIIQKECQPKWK